MDVKAKVAQLPLSSGVYLMKDRSGHVIYVGKAVSIRQRVRSYFRKNKTFSKTDFLVPEIAEIDVRETASEAEALILEASLIKQYKPKYNFELKDDKSYPVIEITPEKFPRVSVQRPRVRKRGADYYGPYVNARLVREALDIIRKIFHFRVCDPLPGKPCLDYHIGLCDAPCIGKIDAKAYAKIVKNVRMILAGEKDTLYKSLRQEMERFSRAHQYESAAKIRDQIRAIGALYSGTPDMNYYKEAEQLQRKLNLPRLPERIEAFDISNIMGNQAVGSMVSFLNGKPDKQNYRRFRIKEVTGVDDYDMIAEVVRRRYRRLKEERLTYPDLIVIDGGKGQLSSAREQLKQLEVDIPILAIAKREEEIFLPNRHHAVCLTPDSLARKLVQRVRDEAHRFAVAYHRQLRQKYFFRK